MKRSLLLIVILIPVFALCAEIKDVSPGLDVYEAVNYVVDKGIMELDSKGYFRGALLITRFDLAQYLYNLINVFSLEDLSKMKNIPKEVGVIKSTFVALDARVTKIDEKIGEVMKSLENLSKLEQKVENVEKFGKGLERSIKEMEKEISSIRSSINKLKGDVGSIREGLLSVKNEISIVEEKFTKKIDAIKSDVLNLEKAALTLSSSITSLATGVDIRMSELKEELSGKLAAITQKFDKAIKDLKLRNEDFRKILMNLTEYYDTLKSRIDENKHEIELLSSANDEIFKRLSRMEKEMSSVRSDISALRSDVSTLESSITAEISIIRKDFDELKSNIDINFSNTESEITILKKELWSLKERTTVLESNLVSTKKEMERLVEKVEAEELKAKITRMASNLSELEDEVSSIKLALKDYERKLKKAEDKISIVEKEIEEVRGRGTIYMILGATGILLGLIGLIGGLK